MAKVVQEIYLDSVMELYNPLKLNSFFKLISLDKIERIVINPNTLCIFEVMFNDFKGFDNYLDMVDIILDSNSEEDVKIGTFKNIPLYVSNISYNSAIGGQINCYYNI